MKERTVIKDGVKEEKTVGFIERRKKHLLGWDESKRDRPKGTITWGPLTSLNFTLNCQPQSFLNNSSFYTILTQTSHFVL